MNTYGWRWMAAVAGWCLLVAAGGAQQVNAFPHRHDPLHVRVAAFEKLMWGNHCNEGIFMPHVIFPPVGEERPLVGNQEDAADETAMMLAAYSFKYAATKEASARTQADQVMDALLKLETVTDTPGWIARTFNRVEAPLWHEQVYFFPLEWHDSTSMAGYRWQGDLSSDKFVNVCCALGIYFDFCADEEHRPLAAGLIDRFVGRVVDHNFRMVDIDGKMTLWGNFCPDLPHENLNSLEILAGLKSAYHLTGKDRYRMAYHMLIDRHHYDDEAILAKVLWPEKWKTPWDDHLAAKSLYPLLRYETDATLRQKYRMSLHRHWYDWKERAFSEPSDIYLAFLYQVLAEEPVVNDKIIQGAKHMWGFDREKRLFTIPTAEGAKTLEAEEEGSAAWLVLTYWFGRHYGFIEPGW